MTATCFGFLPNEISHLKALQTVYQKILLSYILKMALGKTLKNVAVMIF
jgi:hypothetical protein